MADQAEPEQRKRFDWRGMDRRDKVALALLLLVVALGMGLRFRGITWSLPDLRHPTATYHPDERVNLNAAMQADIAHGQFDIKFYNYGTFYFYLVNLAQTIGAGYGVIPKFPAADAPPDAQLAGEAATNASLFLAGRIVSALLGTATLPVLYALGRRMYGRKAGLLAALLYGVAPLAVLHAHFLTVDVTATFFVTLTLLWSARLLASPTWSNYALAAVWAGLATATKYNAGLVLIAPIAAHFLNKAPDAGKKHRAGQFVVLIALAMLTFLIACPGPWLNFDAFWNGIKGYPGSGLRYELFVHSRSGHGYLFMNTGNGWWYHLTVSLPFGLGIGLLITALIGLVQALRQRTKADWVLLGFFLVYFGISGLSNVRFARYMLPLFPVFCLWAARFLADLRLPGNAGVVVGLLVPVLPLCSSYYLLLCMTTQDPRDAAADYLEQHAPQGASIAFATVPWFYSPPLSPGFGELSASQRLRAAEEVTRFKLIISPKRPPEEWDKSVFDPRPNYVVLSDIETMHPHSRLHLDAPDDFIKSLPFASWRIFPPPVTQDPLYSSAIIPEDIMYVRPTITVYFR
ncbi:MAG: 4-amino-4-deoxy-L-arabinose transferase and related glycosyltransferase of family [Chthonomonadaceae bacterium]|nr:4-amino-4-deoxy-L-arabinose transferase and related glycosyltransferase of family [Chthonomonadaceae bacterium]